ncbi:MAG: single-stranded-DNA-specific exonuclease RecJ [Terriglobia bacterium]
MDWIIANPDPGRIRTLAHSLNLSGTIARLLVNRGITDPEQGLRFLQPTMDSLPDPFLMRDMPEAVDRILAGIERGEKMLIYGDYDVDGTTSVVILRKALEMLGAQVSYHIPRRFLDGYGMTAPVVRRSALDGVRLIISVDTGIKAFEVVETAKSLGIDYVITDHHLPEEALPNAVAVLNPNRTDCPYPDKNLCGVGVAFKLVQALFMKAQLERHLISFLKIVALGTIADVVPLIGENRVFAKIGLEGLRSPVNVGLKSLIKVCGLDCRSISSFDVGYRLAPRINAVGRMGGGAQVVELFSATSAEQSRQLAGEMDRLNRDRQQIEMQILREVEGRLAACPELSKDWVIVMDGESWHRGVLGIVATKISERFTRPVLVIARENGVGYGSGRSPKGFHLLNALENCRELFDRFGGHAQAAGFQLPTRHIDELKRRLSEYTREILQEQPLQPRLEVDAEVRLSDLDDELYRQVESLSPFGTANPQPVFVARDLAIVGEPRVLKGRHLKFRVEQDGKAFDALGWNFIQNEIQPFPVRGKVSLAFALSSTSYQGMTALQLNLKDVHMP